MASLFSAEQMTKAIYEEVIRRRGPADVVVALDDSSVDKVLRMKINGKIASRVISNTRNDIGPAVNEMIEELWPLTLQ